MTASPVFYNAQQHYDSFPQAFNNAQQHYDSFPGLL